MAVNRETSISAANYNTLQNRVARILGSGVGQSGYGQTLKSSPVSAKSVVYAEDMNELLADINAISIHQTGNATDLQSVSRSTKILADEVNLSDNNGFNQYIIQVELLESTAGLVDGTQVALETLASDRRYSEWKGKLQHLFTLTFNNADHRRAFFNAGGEIWLSAQLEAASTPKNNDWNQMLSNMGVIKFKANNIEKTGFGGTIYPVLPADPVGNFQLVPTFQKIFDRSGEEGSSYAENFFRISVKEISTSAIQFLVEFEDNDIGDPNFDEAVTGSVTSIVQSRRPSGSFVSLPSPSYSVQSSLELGD